MPKPAPYLAGQTFGRLTVIMRAAARLGGLKAWVCRCACGNVKIVTGANLLNSRTRSCGCLRRDRASKLARKRCSGKLRAIGSAAFNDRDDNEPD